MAASGNGLVFSCYHAPYQHPAALDFLADLKRVYRPDWVYHLGDEIDANGWSAHPRVNGAPSAAHELNMAKDEMRRMFKVFPRVKVCISNHGDRHFRAADMVDLPRAFVRELGEVLKAPRGWVWRDYWIQTINGKPCRMEHGDRFKGEHAHVKAMQINRMSTCIGHIHSFAGVCYRNNGLETCFAVNTGCLVDPDSFGMLYARKYPHAPTLGATVFLDGVPYFHPLGV